MNVGQVYLNEIANVQESQEMIENVAVESLLKEIKKVTPLIKRYAKNHVTEKDTIAFFKRTMQIQDDYVDNLKTISEIIKKTEI